MKRMCQNKMKIALRKKEAKTKNNLKSKKDNI